MVILFLVLIVIACLILGFVILIQNPKGGGLSGSMAGIGNQFMGVDQTNKVLDKATWIFVTIIALLCISSSVFIKDGTSKSGKSTLDNIPTTGAGVTAPAAAPEAPANTVDTNGQPVSTTPTK
ncbi:preprotein translocase subunit SecG [Polluticaenibacter yanchengensis]|uniref:Protein-export membrane protein SecG n=1 Tax=Polluticaenibacter yanchengensis TaxID=3014562 RepID=A0ABT4UHV2_9BACT|nr:preprotein translocase subunit SecG [Chitinophagaceae bacterium LY-5]